MRGMKRLRFLSPLLVLVGVSILACSESPDIGTSASSGPVLPFIEDDYEAALAEARARDLPIFIESWAPW
jgi:hypothetical protein